MKSSAVWGACVMASLGLMACENDNPLQIEPAGSGPVTTILDGTHGGRPGFYFLAPISKTTTRTGPFEAGVEPVVEICALGNSGGCATTIATYTMTSGTGAEVVRRDLASEQYIVNWATGPFALNPSTMYRISVRLWSLTLGFVDVDVAGNAAELNVVDRSSYVGVLNGTTLPIKFRIEEGALWAGLPSLTLDRSSAPPGGLVVASGYNRGASPITEYALVIGNRQAPLSGTPNGGHAGSVPLFLKDGWPAPPSGAQDVVLLKNGVPVAGANNALTVTALADAPGSSQQALAALKGISNRFSALGNQLAPVVSVQQAYTSAAMKALGELIAGPGHSINTLLAQLSGDARALRLLDALFNSSGALAALKQYEGMLNGLSVGATTPRVAGAPLAQSSIMPASRTRQASNAATARSRLPLGTATPFTNVGMPCPVALGPYHHVVTDIELAKQMQWYEVVKLFSTTVVGATNATWSNYVANFAGILAFAGQPAGALAATIGAVMQVADVVANKIIVGLMPADITTFDVSLAGTQLQLGELTNATVRVVARNDAPTFGIQDVITTILAVMGAGPSADIQTLEQELIAAATWFRDFLQNALASYASQYPSLNLDVSIYCIPLMTWEATISDPRLVERRSQTPSIIDGDLVEVNWRASQTTTGTGRIFAQPSMSASATLITPPPGVLYTGGAFGDDILASNVVTVQVGGTSVSVAPGTVTLGALGTQQFTATVTNASSTAVTWSTDDPGGVVTSTGFYTAGSTPGIYAVTATSVADPTKTGAATVQVTAPPSNGRVQLVGINGNISASVSLMTASGASVDCREFKSLANGSVNANASCSATGVNGNAMSGSASGSATVTQSGGTGSNASMSVMITGGDNMTATSNPQYNPSNFATASSQQAYGVSFDVIGGSAHYSVAGQIQEIVNNVASNQEFGYVIVILMGPNGKLHQAEVGARAIGNPTHLPAPSINWSGTAVPGRYFLSINTYPTALGGTGPGGRLGTLTTATAATSFSIALTTTP